MYAELPGLTENDVKVEINNDVLIIQGERKVEQNKTEGGAHLTERQYGQFYRAIALPEGADAEHANAEMQNGVLHISVPVAQARATYDRFPSRQQIQRRQRQVARKRRPRRNPRRSRQPESQIASHIAL